jgi:hypothetical protein
MGTAASDGKIRANPCVIRGAGTARRVHKIRPASLDEIETITQEMPERYRVMVLLAAWCALRFGELTELRLKDITIVEPTAEELATAVLMADERLDYLSPAQRDWWLALREPPPIAARSRWFRGRACAEHMVARRWQHFTVLTCCSFAGRPSESTVRVGVDR